MPIVINYKICDSAPECGGIEVCPNGAFYWNEQAEKPEVNNTKCISCGVCVRECPVGAILLAQDQKEYDELAEKVKNDPRSGTDLWQEKLGVQPGRTEPLATIITSHNFKAEISESKGLVLLDVWSEETMDCRFHSVSFVDLGLAHTALKKLEGASQKELAEKLKANKFPTLILYKDGFEIWRHEGYIYSSDKSSLVSGLIKLVS